MVVGGGTWSFRSIVWSSNCQTTAPNKTMYMPGEVTRAPPGDHGEDEEDEAHEDHPDVEVPPSDRTRLHK